MAAAAMVGIGLAADEVRVSWAATPVAERLRVLRRCRQELARRCGPLADAISSDLRRTRADTYAAEILPLLAACKFLEEEAEEILAPRRLGRRGLPFWLAGVDNTVERVPLGTVLVIAPANYPLFLGGVQALQALAAGNSVVWKPGRGGAAVAHVFAEAARVAGLPEGLLRVTGEAIEDGIAAMNARPDKVFFTGGAEGGRAVMRMAAEAAIPVVAELSGCDAVVVLPSADVARVVDALAFGMRLNGSETCMAPRRLFVVGGRRTPPQTMEPSEMGHPAVVGSLIQRFAGIEAAPVGAGLRELLADAEAGGATVVGGEGTPTLVLNGRAEMRIAQADVFAPVLTVIAVEDVEAVVAADAVCPLGLTVAVFGDEAEALALGKRLKVGTVIVNDLIVPTADPRVPFGGRRGSGFGVTRGREGLLEMAAVRVVAVRRGKGRRQYEATGAAHEAMFHGAVGMTHGATLRERFRGLREMVAAARKMK